MNTDACKTAIEKKFSNFKVQVFENDLVVNLDDDYTHIFICSDKLIQKEKKHDIYVFINTENDEIKGTVVFKKCYDLDKSKSDEDNCLLILEDTLLSYAIEDRESWQPILDDLKKYNTPDVCDGEHAFQKIEEILGIKKGKT